MERFSLANGLRVVLHPDRSSPSVTVSVSYDVGFRSEPVGRTGFAHLFEHLMFQGSATLDKLEHARLVQGNGGTFNGGTSNDWTNYFEELPSGALELALFLEADRMRSVRLTPENLHNQVEVVKEEIRVNVHNQPYGGFPWIDLPAVLFETFPNAHDGYGDFADLEAATLDEAAAFFDRYYCPANAVLVVAGDLDVSETQRLIDRHFRDLPARPAPARADLDEPLPSSVRRRVRRDRLAPLPAVAAGWRMPQPSERAYVAAVLLAEVLSDGEASRLWQRLVKVDRIATRVSASVGLLADAFSVRHPAMFEIVAHYPPSSKLARVLSAVDEEIAHVADGIDADELARYSASALSSWLRMLDPLTSRAHRMAAFELLRGRAELVNELPGMIASITPDEVSSVARDWLLPDRRAILQVQPTHKP